MFPKATEQRKLIIGSSVIKERIVEVKSVMCPVCCAGVISLRAALPLRALLLEQWSRTWHNHLACRAGELAFPSELVLKTWHKCYGPGDWCPRLQVQPHPVRAESRAVGSLQLSLHSEGNVWPL